MSQYRLIQKQSLIDKSTKDVASTIVNSFGAFATDIKYSLSSIDEGIFVLKLTHQDNLKTLDYYVTIIIGATNQNNAQTELELLISYKSDENIYKAWFHKRKIRWVLNNFLSEFKKRCEKWL